MQYFENGAQKKSLIHIVVGVCAAVLVLLLILFSQKEKLNPADESVQFVAENSTADIIIPQPGLVYGESGIPLEGAVVIADNKKFITDKKGAWTFFGVQAGTDITVLAYGYSPYLAPFNPDNPIQLNLFD